MLGVVLFPVMIVATSSTWRSDTCPASWTINRGVCIWPKQQLYKTVDVSGAKDIGAACCAICASEKKCVEWLAISAPEDGFKANTCFLNNHTVYGNAPNKPSCTSGSPAPAPLPPTPKPKPAPSGAKNVLFFAVDDLRPEISAFGDIPGTVQPHMHTPHFDALASKSLVLTKNYVQQAVCSPTRTSLLSGRRPDRTRVYDLYSNFRTVGGNYTTLPEFFKNNGYKTIGMGKIFHPGHASGAGAMGGSDDACCSWSNASAYFHAPNLGYWSGKAGGGAGGKSWFSVDPKTEAEKPLPDNQTANHAIQTLHTLQRQYTAGDQRPFFLAVGFHKPHLPFISSSEFFEYYPEADVQLPPDQQPPQGMPRVAWSNYGELLAYSDQAKLHASGQPGTVLPKDDVLALRRAYYAAVTQTDAMLGKVMAALEQTDFVGNTVISIWGDHGWQLGEHGEWCKHTNFELATRAPMMIHVPGLTDKGIVTSHYSEHIDLFPTLTEAAAGVHMPVCPPGDASFKVALCTEGTSLVPLMKDPSTPVKAAAFSQYPRGYQKPDGAEMSYESLEEGDLFVGKPSTSQCIKDGVKGCTMGYTVATRVDGHEYRYTEWADFNTEGFRKKVNWGRIVGVELYNHTSDPAENFNINVTRAKDERVISLSSRLSALLHSGPTFGPSSTEM